MRSAIIFTLLFLGACTTNTGIIRADNDAYMVSERYPMIGIGPAVQAQADVYRDANEFCGKQSKSVQTVELQTTPSAPAQLSSATLKFRCGTDETAKTLLSIEAECSQALNNSALDPILTKVELTRSNFESPVPFGIASNAAYPTQEEIKAIATWATVRDECVTRQRNARTINPGNTPMQTLTAQQDMAFVDGLASKIGALIVALYQGKLSYGEFAQKRYEFGHETAAAQREFRQAVLSNDLQIAMQKEQLATQRFQANISAWSAYLQSVNAREPKTIVRVEQNVTIR